MFILCPHCQFLVAIEPATGLPPSRCPRCGNGLGTTGTAPADRNAAQAADVAGDIAPEPLSSSEPVDADAVGEAVVQSHTDVEIAAPPTNSEVLFDLPTPTLEPPSDPAPELKADSEPAPAPMPATPSPSAPAEAATPPPVRRSRAAAPSFVRAPTTGAGPTRRWPTATIIGGLSLLLVLQLLIADRARLAADARWRPAVTTLCAVLRCTLPMWHEPEAFVLVARDVGPSQPGVLHVAATFRNDARWAQAWPALHLALQDVDGRTIGARVFAPAEYLGGRQTQNGLAPGQVASIAFDVGEPPGTVVAFTFDFR